MKYRDVARKLGELGCQEIPRRGCGSHRKWFNPLTDKITVVPDWGSRDLRVGTVRGIVRQLELDWNEFNNV